MADASAILSIQGKTVSSVAPFEGNSFAEDSIAEDISSGQVIQSVFTDGSSMQLSVNWAVLQPAP